MNCDIAFVEDVPYFEYRDVMIYNVNTTVKKNRCNSCSN